MLLSAHEKGEFLVLSCPEEIDAILARQIELQLETWLSKAKNIALDFRAVESIDPNGFRALAALANAAKKAGLKTVTFNPKKPILAKIKKEGLEGILNPINT